MLIGTQGQRVKEKFLTEGQRIPLDIEAIYWVVLSSLGSGMDRHGIVLYLNYVLLYKLAV
jgi:hypothetical protein